MFQDEISYLKQPEPFHLTSSQIRIIEEARSWIGTPFHHQGRLKGVGVDCLGLVLGVMKELGLTTHYRDRYNKRLPFTKFDITNYSREPDGRTLKRSLDLLIDPINDVNTIQPGDIALFFVKERPQHLGIIGNHNGLSVIHALEASRYVAEHTLNQTWCSRLVALYRIQPEHWESD